MHILSMLARVTARCNWLVAHVSAQAELCSAYPKNPEVRAREGPPCLKQSPFLTWVTG